MDVVGVGYAYLDAGWVVRHLNTAGERLTRTSAADLVGRDHWQVFPALAGTEVEAAYRRAIFTGEQVSVHAHYDPTLGAVTGAVTGAVSGTGLGAGLEVRTVPLGGGLALYLTDLPDLTDLSAPHTARAPAELAARRQVNLAALGGSALALLEADDVLSVLAVLAEQGLVAMGCDGGALSVTHPDDPTRLRCYLTESVGEQARAEFAEITTDDPLAVSAVARTGEPVLLPDQAATEAFSPWYAAAAVAAGTIASVHWPMHAGGRLLGVLTATWRTPQALDVLQVDAVETYAAQCAQALISVAARDAERTAAAEAALAAQAARESAAAAQRAAAAQAVLVAAAQALAGAETEDAVLAVIARHGAPLVGANGAGLCLPHDSDPQVLRILVTEDYHRDIAAQVQLVPITFDLPAVDTTTTGTPHYLPDLAAVTAAFPGAAALFAAGNAQATASVPLRAGGQLLGSLSFAMPQPHPWSQQERELVEALAALAAQALARVASHTAEAAARTAEQSAHTQIAGFAETLQRAMLTDPPEPDHLQIAVRYTASAAHAEVGGDWYDAFITSDGTTSLIIGDVTGHDMRAAATMGQYRNLLRGICYAVGEPPANVLTTLDHAAAALGMDAGATVVLAQVEQDREHRAAGTRVLRWSNAGHVPPLLVEADGAVRYLDPASDLLLGYDPGTARHDHEVVLEPGATVLLYTDGLIERRRVGLQPGLDWLALTVADLTRRGLSLEELCDALLAQVQGHLDDDVALLALRAHPEDAPRPAEAGPRRVPDGVDGADAF